jgi:hypothetical protein
MSNSNYLFIGAYLRVPAKYYTKTTIIKNNFCQERGILHGEQKGNFCSVCGSPVETTKETKVSTQRLWYPVENLYEEFDDGSLRDEWKLLNMASENSEFDYYHYDSLEYIDMRYNENPSNPIIELYNHNNTFEKTETISREIKRLEQMVSAKKYLNNTKSFADLLDDAYGKPYRIYFGVIHDPEY